jgi:PTH2 family peptidyl-tRNA hydrolase
MTYLFYLIFCILGFIIGANYKKVLLIIYRKLKNKVKTNEENLDKKDEDTKDDKSDEGEEIFDFDNADLKMVFLVREDLKLGAGKIAAQVAHAAVGLYEDINDKGKPYYKQALDYWNEFGAKKIVLRVNDLEVLKRVSKLCKKYKYPSIMISDAGHTQVDPGTVTVLGIGPEASEKINKITGEFKLMR